MAGNEWDEPDAVATAALAAPARNVEKTAEQLEADAKGQAELEAKQAANREAAKAKAREKAAAKKDGTDEIDDEAEEVLSEFYVKIKCIVKNGPWTDRKKLAFKETAIVPRAIAELMESKDQVVVL